MFQREKPVTPHLVTLLAFVEDVLRSAHAKEAKRIVDETAEMIPELRELRMTAQTPPHHAEGARIEAHLTRMLAVLFSITERKDLFFIEEIAREREYALEVRALVEILVEHKDFFVAYAIAHDFGKTSCLRFDATEGKMGALEGFKFHAERLTEIASDSERQRYDKLFRAFEAGHPELHGPKLVAAFYEYSGIGAHYKGHDRVGAGIELSKAREDVLRAFHLPLSNAKILSELIRLHMDIICTFEKGSDVLHYQAFGAIALKAGLNKDLFFDLALGAMFLDGIVGSLHYENGAFDHPIEALFNFFRAEREVAPERHELRLQAEHREKKAQVKALLDAGGLSPEAVFDLLSTPIGPVRGEVMRNIYELVHEPSLSVDFGTQTEEIRSRARKTQALFQERGIPFTL